MLIKITEYHEQPRLKYDNSRISLY